MLSSNRKVVQDSGGCTAWRRVEHQSPHICIQADLIAAHVNESETEVLSVIIISQRLFKLSFKVGVQKKVLSLLRDSAYGVAKVSFGAGH